MGRSGDGEAVRSPDQIAGVAGMAMGAATALMGISLRGSEDLARTLRSPGPRPWFGFVILAGAAVALAIPRLRRNPYVATLVFGFIPIGAAIAVERGLRPDIAYARWVHAVGLLLSIAALFVRGVWFESKKRELDRLVLKDSAVIALYVTVATGAVCGVAQELFDAPKVSLAVLSVVAMGAWTLAHFVLERRYS
jgi:hypothetical protein